MLGYIQVQCFIFGIDSYTIAVFNNSDRTANCRFRGNVADDETVTEFEAVVRLDTELEVEYYRNGGILQTVLRQLV